jgi:hypothetical protein
MTMCWALVAHHHSRQLAQIAPKPSSFRTAEADPEPMPEAEATGCPAQNSHPTRRATRAGFCTGMGFRSALRLSGMTKGLAEIRKTPAHTPNEQCKYFNQQSLQFKRDTLLRQLHLSLIDKFFSF